MSSSIKLLRMYQSAVRIRIAEELAAEYYVSNKIFSFVHFAVGQEIAAVAIAEAVSERDVFLGNHRSHHHFLAKGGDPYRMFAEMLGKSDGCCKGRGGSMHMYQPSVGFLGTSPILSSAIPIAAGIAKSLKEDSSGDLAVVFTGDGASEEGNFYETLNLAKLLELPLLIVVENNNYAVNSGMEKRRPSSYSLEALCSSFGVDYFTFSSDDPLQAIKVAEAAVLACREPRPVVVEAKVVRFMSHSAPLKDDDAQYRTENMAEVRAHHDPIAILEAQLSSFSKETIDFDLVKQSSRTKLHRAFMRAVESPEPDPSTLMDGVYSAKIY